MLKINKIKDYITYKVIIMVLVALSLGCSVYFFWYKGNNQEISTMNDKPIKQRNSTTKPPAIKHKTTKSIPSKEDEPEVQQGVLATVYQYMTWTNFFTTVILIFLASVLGLICWQIVKYAIPLKMYIINLRKNK